MAHILRVKMRWTGFPGGPGYSIFHFGETPFGGDGEVTQADAQTAAGKVDTFAAGLKAWLPYNVKLDVESDVEVIDVDSGNMSGVFGVTVNATHVSPQALGQTFAAAVGAHINWRTNGIKVGRRVKGKTFLVPLNGGVFDTDGSLATGLITSLNTHAEALRSLSGDLGLGVYCRPPMVGAGQFHMVIAHNVPDKCTVLRSRRD